MTAQNEVLVNTGLSNISRQYAFNADLFTKATADVQRDDWFRQPANDSNHLMWVAGHVLATRGNVVLKLLGALRPSPALWPDVFGRGAKLVERGKYPDPQEIRDTWIHVANEVASALQNVSEEILSKPAPPGPPPFAGKVSSAVAFFALHETYHIGQIGFLRKWLGYSQLVG